MSDVLGARQTAPQPTTQQLTTQHLTKQPTTQQPSDSGPPAVTGGRRRWSRRWLWLGGAVLVLMLVAVTAGLFSSAASSNRADDPRSAQPAGTAALASLLEAEGVRIVTVGEVDRAVELAGPATTLVVANPDRLREEEGRRLLAGRPGRVILLRPTLLGLRAFGAAASTATAESGVFAPACAEPAAVRAGPIVVEDGRAVYRSNARPASACYPVGTETGSAWLRTGGVTGSIDLVAGGMSNAGLGQQGNAAFGMNVFGSQPTVVWLMAERAATDRPERPTLLPSWWAIGLVQLAIAVVVIGIWQGRRLGPIMVEALPVRVRSSETVVGHGRLYHRIGARDRAAEALRAGARNRLGRRFGHRHDPDALAATLAEQTRQPVGRVWAVLYGSAPATDDELTDLARALDQLEQDARR